MLDVCRCFCVVLYIFFFSTKKNGIFKKKKKFFVFFWCLVCFIFCLNIVKKINKIKLCYIVD
jgi:F0F1-type ATP synthase membrane subunit a